MTLTVVDRLSTARRERLDVAAFLFAVVLGVTLYLTLRWSGAPQYFMTLAVIGVMGTYAIAVSNVRRLRVRLDQAGDNAYYLGLLFTLASMALALYEFGVAAPSEGEAAAARVIANFGIALASTIVGIFLRVLLHQMRVDPADMEDASRLELADAANRVKATLDHVSQTMASASNEVAQRTEDHLRKLHERSETALSSITETVVKQTTATIRATTAAQEETTRKVSNVTDELVKLASELQGAAARLASVEPPPLKLASRLEKVSTKLEDLSAAVERAAQAIEQAGASSNAISSRADAAILEMARVADKAAQQQSAEVQRTHALVNDITNALQALNQQVEHQRSAFADLDAQVRRSATSAHESQESARRVLDNLVEATERLVDFVKRAG